MADTKITNLTSYSSPASTDPLPIVDVGTSTTKKITVANLSAGMGLVVASGKTLTVSKTMTLTAADDTGVYTLPTGTKTLVATDVTSLSSLVTVSDLTTGSIGTGFVVKGVTMTLGSDASNDMYYRNSSGVLTRFASGNNGVVITSGTGVPSVSSTLPSAVQGNITSLGTVVSGKADTGFVIGGVTMTLASGSDASGDMYYRNSSGVLTRIAPGAQNKVLTMGASSVPGWSDVSVSSVATITVTAIDGLTQTANAVRAYHNAAQSISDSTETALAFNSERFSNNGNMHNTASQNTKFFAPSAGVYAMFFTGGFALNAVGQRIIYIRLNGSTEIAEHSYLGTSTDDQRKAIATLYKLAASDYVEVTVYQSSTGSLNFNSSGNVSPEFSMIKLSS